MTTPDTTTPHGGAPTLDAMAERLRDHLEGAWGYEMGLHDVKLALADALTGLSPGPERDAAVAAAMSRLSGPAADAAGLVDAVRKFLAALDAFNAGTTAIHNEVMLAYAQDDDAGEAAERVHTVESNRLGHALYASRAVLDAALATRPAIAEVAQTDDEILDDFALALTAENPARNELRDARQAVLSRMKGTSR